MYLRNLMSMDTEEMIRAQPMDAVVLIGGCDKTVPAQLMGAASAGIPAIQLITGSMLTGSHRGERVGACTDCRRYWGKFRADEIDERGSRRRQQPAGRERRHLFGDGHRQHDGLHRRSAGHDGARRRVAAGGHGRSHPHRRETGAQAVQMARDDLTIDKILTPDAFENAMRVLLAIGGSTNGIIHLTAIAGRVAGSRSTCEALDRMGRETPVLVDLKPSGQHYMEDFHHAGGMATLLRELKPLLQLDALTVTGRTLGEEIERAGLGFAQDVVRPFDRSDLSAGRHRRAARQSRAGRRDHQAIGGRSRTDGARRPRGRVRERRGPGEPHRRRRPRRHGRRHPRAQEHRPEGRAGHARGGLYPDPAQAGARRASRTSCGSPTAA